MPRPRQIKKSSRRTRQSPYYLRPQRAPIRNNVAFTSWSLDDPNLPNLNQYGRRRRHSRRRGRSRSRSQRNSHSSRARENDVIVQTRNQTDRRPKEIDQSSTSSRTASKKAEHSSQRKSRTNYEESINAVTLHRNANFKTSHQISQPLPPTSVSEENVSNKEQNPTTNNNNCSEAAIRNSEHQSSSRSNNIIADFNDGRNLKSPSKTTTNFGRSSKASITDSNPDTSSKSKNMTDDLNLNSNSQCSTNPCNAIQNTEPNLDAPKNGMVFDVQTPVASTSHMNNNSKKPAPKHEELPPPRVDTDALGL